MTSLVFQREARVKAPVQLVWDEVGSLDAVIARTPQALTHLRAANGKSAAISGNLHWGPFKHTLAAEVSVVELVPTRQIDYRIVAPSLESHYDGRITLHAVGAAETELRYHGELDLRSPAAKRFRGMLSDLVEEHVHGMTEQAKARAERRQLAEEKLGK